MAAGSKDRRERAAAARAAAQAGEKRRERLVRIIGAAVVGLVVIGIIGVAVLARNSEQAGNDLVVADVDPDAPRPSGTFGPDEEFAFAVPYGTASENAPVVEIWEDMQCPACGTLEAVAGASLGDAAEAGDIRLIWRPVTFLDRGTDASTRAVAAWGCAIDAGKTREYHDRIYADQPQEGQGWTDEQLLAYGADVGLSGEEYTAFEQCVNDRTYASWAANGTAEAATSGINATPTVLVNGSEVFEGQDVRTLLQNDPEAFLAALTGGSGN